MERLRNHEMARLMAVAYHKPSKLPKKFKPTMEKAAPADPEAGNLGVREYLRGLARKGKRGG